MMILKLSFWMAVPLMAIRNSGNVHVDKRVTEHNYMCERDKFDELEY